MTDKRSPTATEDTHQTRAEGKRPYQAPRILSAEPLEAAAATCDPQTGAFGKSIPTPCGVLGS